MREPFNVVPVCIRQIHECKTFDFQLSHIQAVAVEIVGILEKVVHKPTHNTFTVRDHTGTILAVQWLDPLGWLTVPQVTIGRFVHILGGIRQINGVKKMELRRIECVENPNRITTHLLEVIHARYAIQKFSKNRWKMVIEQAKKERLKREAEAAEKLKAIAKLQQP